MENKALFDLSYGVFMLATEYGNRKNGCITNTCIQVAANPERLVISCMNSNLTCELLKKRGVFSVSVLDKTCRFETIKHFGMQSGRNTNKFEGTDLPTDVNGIPYMKDQACAMFSCRILDYIDLKSHTLFIADIVDAKVLSDNEPLTYAEYHSKLKPKKPEETYERDPNGWKCSICGFVYDRHELPVDYRCPRCGHGAEDFEPVYVDLEFFVLNS